MYNKQTVAASALKANCALELERRIVAVKFLFTRKKFEQADALQLSSRLRYCSMIEHATRGERIKADFSNFGCFSGARALGIVQREDFYLSGRFFYPRGLYCDLATSKEVTISISACQHRAYGIQTMPIEEFDDSPDVVLIVSNPRNIMRLVQGYTYHFGPHGSHKMIGNQAICAESTAHPYETNDINVSLLCAGARGGGFNDHEMAIGLPFNRFERIIDGLCMTITPVETNDVKRRIAEKLEAHGITDVAVVLDRNYAKPFFARDLAYFSRQREKSLVEEEELLPDIWQSENERRGESSDG